MRSFIIGNYLSVDLEGRTVGRKQASGFINAYNIEPITYRPNENFSTPNTRVCRHCFSCTYFASFKLILPSTLSTFYEEYHCILC